MDFPLLWRRKWLSTCRTIGLIQGGLAMRDESKKSLWRHMFMFLGLMALVILSAIYKGM